MLVISKYSYKMMSDINISKGQHHHQNKVCLYVFFKITLNYPNIDLRKSRGDANSEAREARASPIFQIY